MYIVCLDFEGIVAPEMWVAYANASGISQLTRTTRDKQSCPMLYLMN